MELFEKFSSLYGEHVVQAILENWERYTGHKHAEPMSLEDRWAIFMRDSAEAAFAAA